MTYTCENCGEVHEARCPACNTSIKPVWSWTKFLIGKLGNKLVAWVSYMVLQYIALLTGVIPEQWIGRLIIVTAD